MTIFSSDPVINFVAGWLVLIGVLALVMLALAGRHKPILRPFFLATACGAFSVACIFERAYTSIWQWDIGTALFGLLMFYFLGCTVLRWWRKWGPA